MDQEETPLLVRHPLQVHKKAETPKPFMLATSSGQDQDPDSGSDTDLELMSVGSDAGDAGEGSESDEEVPDTQLVDPRPLAGLIVYVEVRSGTDNCENRQQAIAHQLELLGATVAQRLTKDVTHMVFKDGKQSSKEKAEKKGVYLVSPLWLDACKRANDRVSEAKYPVLSKEGNDSPIVLGRIKRFKSMQPKPLVEEITRSLERSRKRHRTNTPTKATTPAKGRSKPQSKSTKEGSDEEDYELPEIKLPGTPLSDYGSTSVTPEIKKRLTSENTVTPLLGKESSKTKTRNTTSSNTGKGSSNKEATSAVSGTIEKGSTKSNPRNAPSVCVGKGSPKEKVKKGSVVCGKRSTTEQTADEHPAKVASTKANKKTSDSNSKPAKKSLSNKDVASSLSDSDTKSASKSPLQSVCTNKRIKLEEENSEPRPKKRRVRVQRHSFEKQLPTIVLTSVHSGYQDTVQSIVDKLGKFRCARTVCESTTHVICGNPRRTVNILSATLRGCWILSLDWVMKSLECGKWVPEEPFEMAIPFPAARHYRIQRQTSYVTFQPGLFRGCGSVFLSSGTSPPSEQLESLLTLGGGKITTSHRKADVCVGCKSWSSAVKSVSEQWILDSISAHTLLPVDDYLLDCPLTREVSPEL